MRIATLKDFIFGEDIFQEHILAHFRNKAFEINLMQAHFAIVLEGRRLLHDFYNSLSEFLENMDLGSCNTDGIIITLKKALIPDDHFKGTLFLDKNLKLSVKKSILRVDDYIGFKKKLFLKPGFCEQHELEYKNYLLSSNNNYHPNSCCLGFEQNVPLKMRLDFLASHYILMGTNNYVLSNSETIYTDSNSKFCGKTYNSLLPKVICTQKIK